MMHHHNNHGNVHGGGGGGGGAAPHAGPPPGPGPMHRHQMHQPMPHQSMPPHQIHHDTRHPMGLSQPTNMASGGQSMGSMGQQMGVPPPIHGPGRPPHPIRPMTHHTPAQHHMPPMKTMRRPYHVGGSYGAQAPLQPPPSYPQPPPQPPAAHLHHAPPPPPPPPGLNRPTSLPLSVTTTDSVEVSAEGATSLSTDRSEGGSGAAEGEEGAVAQGAGEATRPVPAGSATATPHPLANSKEKTPMCLVNELARFNKIKHQYRLTSETGPAHKKIFTVTLRLGETEEYTAEGSSIKRAQHAAASVALTQTRHTFPPPKLHTHHTPTHTPTRHTGSPTSGMPSPLLLAANEQYWILQAQYEGAVMPTVELNALAMKLCQPAVYTSVPPVPTAMPPPGVRFPRFRPPYPPYAPRFHPPHPGSYPPPPYNQRGVCGMNRGVAPVYRVRVSVGERSWPGEGPTPQSARHDAAARALQDLRDQLPPETAAAAPAPHSPVPASENDGDLLSLDVKSPVSLVHELALKTSLSVVFAVKSERGPPHMRVFATTCTVGELETEGEGNGKKVSKKRAAEKMLEEMRQRWPLALLRSSVTRVQQQQRLKRKQLPPKKKPRNLIKENGEVSCESVSESSDNPISRLAMVRHADRARSPQYLVVEERGAPRKREFIVQCDAPPHHATGVGPNKKTAKRRAAQNVLVAMGLSSPSGEAIMKTNGVDAEKPADLKLRTDTEGSGGGALGGGGGRALGGEVRQPVPGVLLMPDYSHRAAALPVHSTNGISETAATGNSGGSSSAAAGAGSPCEGSPGAKDQLLYLSQLLGFNVQFSDFPKRNHGEYLSLVALSTVPPVMCHGGGASTQQSHEQCSRAALRALAHMGLDAPSHDATQSISSPSAKAGILSSGLND